MNVITLTGNATKEVELSYSQQGTAFAKGTIAVQRNFKNQDGQYDTDFINFKAIGKISEVIANYVKKGDKFGITGSLQINVFEGDKGRQYFTEVIVNGFDFPSRRDNNQGQTNTGGQQQNGGGGQQRTNNNQFTRVDDNPFANDNKTIDISDDDLPF